MKRLNFITLSMSLSVALLGFVGCQQETASTPPVSPAADEHDHDHDHDHAHAHDEQDHSVAGHQHGAGPHDGTITDWGGGKYHVELTVDHDKTQATVYILGGDEKTPTPIDAKTIDLSIVDPDLFLTLSAAPQASDPDGKASRFIGTDEKLGVAQEYEGTLTGLIEGTPYSGDFQE